MRALEDSRATLPLVETLGDSCEHVRRAVARALSWIGDDRARPALIKALKDESYSVRLWSVIGLQKIGDMGVVDALIGALSDPDEAVRAETILALENIGDGKAIEPLIGALKDEDGHVRGVALEVLRETFGVEVSSDFGEALEQIREHREFSEKMETVLNVIVKMEQASGAVRDEELYRVLASGYEIGEDESLDLLVQLMKKGLIHSSRSGYTQISV